MNSNVDNNKISLPVRLQLASLYVLFYPLFICVGSVFLAFKCAANSCGLGGLLYMYTFIFGFLQLLIETPVIVGLLKGKKWGWFLSVLLVIANLFLTIGTWLNIYNQGNDAGTNFWVVLITLVNLTVFSYFGVLLTQNKGIFGNNHVKAGFGIKTIAWFLISTILIPIGFVLFVILDLIRSDHMYKVFSREVINILYFPAILTLIFVPVSFLGSRLIKTNE